MLDARPRSAKMASMEATNPVRKVVGVFATAVSISGVGLGMLLSGWHPIIGVWFMAAGALYILWEVLTCPPLVKAVPEGMLRFLAGVMIAAFALLIVGPDIERTLSIKKVAANAPKPSGDQFPLPTLSVKSVPSVPRADGLGSRAPVQQTKEIAKGEDSPKTQVLRFQLRDKPQTVQVPPHSAALIDKETGPLSAKDKADFDRMIKDHADAKEHLSKDAEKLVLRDLFLTDFSSLDATSTNHSGFVLRNNGSGSINHIDYAVVRQLAIGTRFLLFYIGPTNETEHLCVSLADQYGVAFADPLEGRSEATKLPGDSEQITSQDLVFSNRIFIYHETYLSPEQIIKVREAFKAKGITVILRSSDYLENQRLQARVNQLKKQIKKDF